MRQILTEKCKEIVDESAQFRQFRELGLSTKKVFSDLIIFCKEKQSQEYKNKILKQSIGSDGRHS